LWTAAVALSALGVAATVAKLLGWHWPWLLIALALAGAVLAQPGKLLAGRLERGDQRRQELSIRSVGGGRKMVRDVADPIVLGVHRAVSPVGWEPSSDAGALPTYVLRDQHEPLVALLTPGRFVLVVGDSGAGKSRLAWETVSAVLGGHRLFAPDPAGLAAAVEEMTGVRQAVLWLDDLERFLATDTLSATAVANLLSGGHRVIVATLRLQELDLLTAESDRGLNESRRRVLAMAERVRVAKAFSTAEVDRAEQRSQDPRIADALAHAGEFGLAEYLAAGPQLLERWRDGATTHPRGAAVVAAAVNCRRAGYLSPLPVSLIDELHEVSARTRPEPLDDAWAWATERWRHTTALLEPAADGRVTVFDYVVDHVQRTHPHDHVPEKVVRTALRHADSADMTAMGHAAKDAGRYQLALDLYTHAVDTLTERNAAYHRDVLTARDNVTTALQHLGHFQDAHDVVVDVLAARRRVLGPDDPDTLASRDDLATVLAGLGHYDEAYAEVSEVVAARSRVLGPEHPDTLTSRSNAASVLRLLGRYDDALATRRAELQACTRVHGPEHPETLISRGNLATALDEVGRHEDALAENIEVLALRQRVFGPEHPNTLTTHSNLTHVLGNLGRHDDALTEARTILATRSRVLGPEHPDTLISRSNVAATLSALGRHQEALDEMQSVVDVETRLFGPEHPQTLASRNNVAGVLDRIGRYDEALAKHRDVLAARSRVLGPDHPDTLASRNNIAGALKGLGRHEEASAEHREVLAARTQLLGPTHPHTLASRINLGAQLRELRHYDEAATELRTALDACIELFGADHPTTNTARNTLIAALLGDKLDDINPDT
jgi:tetratricopeptide (TPR) repeat protein